MYRNYRLNFLEKKCKKIFVKEKYVIFYSQNFLGFKKKDKWVINVLIF